MTARLLVTALALCSFASVTRAADDDFNPYKGVKVGDFATYKLNVTIGELKIGGTTTQTVTAKTDKEVTVKVVNIVNGMETPPMTETIDITKPFDPTKIGGGLGQGIQAKVDKLKEGKEKVKVAGKEYDCTWTTYKVKAMAMGMNIDADTKVWMSKDIQMGIVKLEMTADLMNQKMEMTMDLTDTGNKK